MSGQLQEKRDVGRDYGISGDATEKLRAPNDVYPCEWNGEQIGIEGRPLRRIFQKIRLAEPYFRLISGSAEFLRKLRNSAENTPKHHKFGQQDRQIETIKLKI